MAYQDSRGEIAVDSFFELLLPLFALPVLAMSCYATGPLYRRNERALLQAMFDLGGPAFPDQITAKAGVNIDPDSRALYWLVKKMRHLGLVEETSSTRDGSKIFYRQYSIRHKGQKHVPEKFIFHLM